MTSMSKLLAVLALDQLSRLPPSKEVLDEFREKCRTADLLLLGQLLHTARHKALEDIAIEEINRRLAKETHL